MRLGTEDGPSAVFDALRADEDLWTFLQWIGTAFAPFRSGQTVIKSPYDALHIIEDHHVFLSHLIRKTITKGLFPLVVGGDHAMAVSTWSTITDACNLREQIGLIWIDAHMDAHTLHTTASFRYHGMPVAALLGYGHSAFVETVAKGAKLHPEDIVLIGVRSFESGERAFLESLNVRIYYMEEVAARGLPDIFREVRAHLKARVRHYGISLDLDSFDPEEIPGVGSPAKNGLLTQDFLESFEMLLDPEQLIGFEIAEFNPHRDKNGMTLAFIMKLLKMLVAYQNERAHRHV